ncbi:unnamed protein product [Mytilus edulis]|uniref:Uncharacterized protein n=1 Tax=Mytilus edulis TaxID=6550 RepID=A0A8S3TR35_MYTED|nr:unnamed protein product [Mytilus edulis]
MEIKTEAPDKEVQQARMNLSIEYGLVQIHDKPTREGNLLDLVFTNNPSLIKSTGNAPGISDHDIVVTDSLIKPYYCKQRPQKRYMFGKANWDQIKTDINMITKDIYNHIHDMPIDKTWQTFKNGVQATIDTNEPSKMIKKKHSVPWLNRKLRKMLNRQARLGRYSAEIFRACRLVVDTGLHHYNWTEERAIKYMLNFTAYGQSDITNEVNRYITWPGQACAYKIGELKIRELRVKAEKELGDQFKIDEFHLVVLQNGAMPLSTLETVTDSWIDQVKNTLGTTETPEDKFDELQTSFSEWLLAENPEFATIINDRRYDDRPMTTLSSYLTDGR